MLAMPSCTLIPSAERVSCTGMHNVFVGLGASSADRTELRRHAVTGIGCATARADKQRLGPGQKWDHLEAEVVYGDAKAEDLLRGVVHLRGQVRGELESTHMCVHAIQDRGKRGKRRERAAS